MLGRERLGPSISGQIGGDVESPSMGSLNYFFCPRTHGLGVRAVAFEARGPGLDSSLD